MENENALNIDIDIPIIDVEFPCREGSSVLSHTFFVSKNEF